MSESSIVEQDEEAQVKDLPRWLTVGGPIVAITSALVTYAAYFIYFHGTVSAEHDTWGQFGDFVGGVLNPIIGFLAFWLLLVTLILQNKELQNSSRELAKSAKALILQNDALALQNFENTFFQMLHRITDIVSQTKFHSVEGREAFRSMCREALDSSHMEYSGLPSDRRLEAISNAYMGFYSEWGRELGHYFRFLYHIFVFIDRSHLSGKDKTVYANIVRAQLSTYELILIFYNGLWGEGKEGFKPLIEKYGILKHVNEHYLLIPSDKDNELLYKRTAFQGREEREELLKNTPVS